MNIGDKAFMLCQFNGEKKQLNVAVGTQRNTKAYAI